MQSDQVTTIPAPVTRDADVFEVLKGNRIMTAINSDLVSIMIAGEGPDFYDKNNTEKAAKHITNIIASKELGGHTTDTLPTALRGRKVKLIHFTTKVMANIGVYHLLQDSSHFQLHAQKSDYRPDYLIFFCQHAQTRCIEKICVIG